MRPILYALILAALPVSLAQGQIRAWISSPNPTYSPGKSVVLGNWVEITVSAQNTGTSTAAAGYISLSFPGLTSTTDGTSNIQVVDAGGGSPIRRSRGATLNALGCGSTVVASHAMTEIEVSNWAPQEVRTFRVSVRPTSAGNFAVRFRHTLVGTWCPSITYSHQPTVLSSGRSLSGYSVTTDQQGFSVYEDIVTVVRNYNLTVRPAGTGSGRVTSNPVGIDCSWSGTAATGTCVAPFASTQTVRLSRTIVSGTFAWGGDCAGTASTCDVSMSQARFADAVWTIPLPDLRVTNVSAPATAQPGEDATVRATVTNAGGAGTSSWRISYYLSGNNTISSELDGNAADDDRLLLTLTRTTTLLPGESVTFDAPVPIPSDVVAGSYYLGAIVDELSRGLTTESSETNNARAPSAPTVIGPVPQYTLTISSAGGDGGVAIRDEADQQKLNCGVTQTGTTGSPCSATYPEGQSVRLVATLQSGSRLVSWGIPGCVETSDRCTFSIAAHTSAPVRAELINRYVDVRFSGTGAGRVVSEPTGLDCSYTGTAGPACLGLFPSGSSVRLRAQATDALRFAVWGDGCDAIANGDCLLTMDGRKTVGLSFPQEALPDFVVDRPTFDATGRYLDITVRNTGTAASAPASVPVAVWASLDETLGAPADILLTTASAPGPIAAGQRAGLQLDFRDLANDRALPAGRYHIFAVVDPTDAVRELGESNNTSLPSVSVQWGEPALADLIIADYDWTPPLPLAGQPVTLHVVIANRGEAESAATRWEAIVNGSVVASGDVPPLLAQAQVSIDALLGPLSPGTNVVAFAVAPVAESNVINNSVQFSVVASAATYEITVGAGGPGSGWLTSSVGGLNCRLLAGVASQTCVTTLPAGSRVELVVRPDPDSEVESWSGACASTSGDRCVIEALSGPVNTLVRMRYRPGTLNLTLREHDGSALHDPRGTRVRLLRLGQQVGELLTPSADGVVQLPTVGIGDYVIEATHAGVVILREPLTMTAPVESRTLRGIEPVSVWVDARNTADEGLAGGLVRVRSPDGTDLTRLWPVIERGFWGTIIGWAFPSASQYRLYPLELSGGAEYVVEVIARGGPRDGSVVTRLPTRFNGLFNFATVHTDIDDAAVNALLVGEIEARVAERVAVDRTGRAIPSVTDIVAAAELSPAVQASRFVGARAASLGLVYRDGISVPDDGGATVTGQLREVRLLLADGSTQTVLAFVVDGRIHPQARTQLRAMLVHQARQAFETPTNAYDDTEEALEGIARIQRWSVNTGLAVEWLSDFTWLNARWWTNLFGAAKLNWHGASALADGVPEQLVESGVKAMIQTARGMRFAAARADVDAFTRDVIARRRAGFPASPSAQVDFALRNAVFAQDVFEFEGWAIAEFELVTPEMFWSDAKSAALGVIEDQVKAELDEILELPPPVNPTGDQAAEYLELTNGALIGVEALEWKSIVSHVLDAGGAYDDLVAVFDALSRQYASVRQAEYWDFNANIGRVGGYARMAVQSAAAAADIPPTAAMLAVVAAPADAVSGVALVPAPVVELRTAQGAAVPTPGVVVRAVASPSGIVLSNNESTTDASGRATFPDLRIAGSGSVTLTFQSEGLTSASVPLTVTLPVVPTTISWSVTPPDGGRVILVDGDATGVAGRSLTLRAEAVESFRFVGWVEAGRVLGQEPDLVVRATNDRSIVAVFERVPTVVSVSVVPPEAGNVATESGTLSGAPGRTLVLRATANAGFRFVEWRESGANLSEQPLIEITAEADREIAAHFERLPTTLAYTVSPAGGGDVIVVEGTLTGAYGRRVILEAQARSRYRFVGWYDGQALLSTSLRLDVVVSTNSSLEARFEQAQPALSIEVAPQGSGSITLLDGALIGPPDRSVRLRAVEGEGFDFVEWREGGVRIGSDRDLSVQMAEADRQVTAVFVTETPQVTVDVSPAQSGGFAVLEGTLEGARGRIVVLEARPESGFRFHRWQENGVALSSDATLRLVVDGPRHLELLFARVVPQTAVTLSAFPDAAGSVVLVSGEQVGDSGRTVIVRADAAVGYSFVRWRSAAATVSIDSVLLVEVHSDTALVAEFSLRNTSLSVTASPDTAGSVALLEGDLIGTPGRTVRLAARAAARHRLVAWTEADTVIATDTVLQVAMNQDRSVVARFELTPTTIRVQVDPDGTGAVFFTSGDSVGAPGRTVNLLARAAERHRFVEWLRGDSTIGTDSVLALRIDDALVELRARFERLPTRLTLSVNVDTAGAVTVLEGAIVGPPGRTVRAVARPALRHRFIHWLEADTVLATDSVLQVSVGDDRAVLARFEPVPTVLRARAVPDSGGIVAWVAGDSVGAPGRSVTLVARSAARHRFVRWRVGSDSIGVDSTITLRVPADLEVLAEFAPLQAHVTLTVLPDTGGTVVPTDGALIGVAGRALRLVARPANRFVFGSWMVGDSVAGTDTALAVRVDRDVNVTARFVPVPTVLSLAAVPHEGGQVVVLDGSLAGDPARSVRVVARAADGWTLGAWVAGTDTLGRDTLLTVAMAESRTITAHFRRRIPVMVPGTSYDGGGGSAGSWRYYRVMLPDTVSRWRLFLSGGSGELAVYVRRDTFPTLDTWLVQSAQGGARDSLDSRGLGDPMLSFFVGVYASTDYSDGAIRLQTHGYRDISVVQVAGGTVTMEEGSSRAWHGQTIRLRAVPDVNREFLYWQRGADSVSTANPYTFVATESATYSAVFRTRQCAVAIGTNGPGTASVVVGSANGDCGRTVRLQASSAGNVVFTHWSSGGALLSTASLFELSVTSAQSVVANFVTLNAVFVDRVRLHLAGTAVLTPEELQQVDILGNRDGQFNLGDFLAIRDRERSLRTGVGLTLQSNPGAVP